MAHANGPIAEILAEMQPEGYWAEPGPGYQRKYRSTVWALIMLAQLGASAGDDERIGRACAYLLDHALTEAGQFSFSGTPSGTIDCLQGNMCWALTELGYSDDRLNQAYAWMARSVLGEGIAPNTEKHAQPRYYAYQCGPNFACGANNKLPCAWGAVKVMQAFGVLPKEKRTGLIVRAIDQGVAFLFSTDPAGAAYPAGFGDKPSGNWWKFGFPIFYVTDLLQLLESLVSLGHGGDPRLAKAVCIVRDKQDEEGHWPLAVSYTHLTLPTN